MFEVELLSEPSRYMRTTWMLSAQMELRLSDSLAIRVFGEDEARLLAESVRKRNVFARHSRENDFYLNRIYELSGRTIIEASFPSDPEGIAKQAEEAVALVDLVEKVSVLSTTLAIAKSDLQRRLGISRKPRSELDFAYDPQLRFLRSRSTTAPTVQGIKADQQFSNRIFRCGFHRLVERPLFRSSLAKRVYACLDWLYESRLEPRLQASIVKTAVALESLLVFSETESLARSLSERSAFILSPSPDTRREISRIIKRFYEARSGVVHGSRKKAKKLTPALAESVDRLSVLLCLVIGSNYQLWSSDDALREWCEDQRWGRPSTDVHIPFARNYLSNAIVLSHKDTP
jgi:hypothetical protein